MQTVNADPREDVIYTTDFVVVSECESGAYSRNPTCGWYEDENKNRIPDSQVINIYYNLNIY